MDENGRRVLWKVVDMQMKMMLLFLAS